MRVRLVLVNQVTSRVRHRLDRVGRILNAQTGEDRICRRQLQQRGLIGAD